jgi:hypothetical protein
MRLSTWAITERGMALPVTAAVEKKGERGEKWAMA